MGTSGGYRQSCIGARERRNTIRDRTGAYTGRRNGSQKTVNIEARDQRTTYWVQSTKQELEGKLGTTFSLSNGMLGIRGAHEECPPLGRPEFYVAGTYAAGPSDLLGFHDADHILSHPDRIKDD